MMNQAALEAPGWETAAGKDTHAERQRRRSAELLQWSDPDISPTHGIEPAVRHCMHLQSYESAGMGLINFIIGKVFDSVAIDPRSDARTLGEDTHVVPAFVV